MRRRPELDPFRRPLSDDPKTDVVNRLKSARGHLDHVIAALDDEAYVLDALRQIAAVRGALDATVRVALRYYFERVFVGAVQAGEVSPALDELMSALAFLKQID